MCSNMASPMQLRRQRTACSSSLFEASLLEVHVKKAKHKINQQRAQGKDENKGNDHVALEVRHELEHHLVLLCEDHGAVGRAQQPAGVAARSAARRRDLLAGGPLAPGGLRRGVADAHLAGVVVRLLAGVSLADRVEVDLPSTHGRGHRRVRHLRVVLELPRLGNQKAEGCINRGDNHQPSEADPNAPNSDHLLAVEVDRVRHVRHPICEQHLPGRLHAPARQGEPEGAETHEERVSCNAPHDRSKGVQVQYQAMQSQRAHARHPLEGPLRATERLEAEHRHERECIADGREGRVHEDSETKAAECHLAVVDPEHGNHPGEGRRCSEPDRLAQRLQEQGRDAPKEHRGQKDGCSLLPAQVVQHSVVRRGHGGRDGARCQPKQVCDNMLHGSTSDHTPQQNIRRWEEQAHKLSHNHDDNKCDARHRHNGSRNVH
mmetsp:Transcript_135666/g.377881  ORF Transcript_135666/g.377881 Transcript_135666/m.377881 type:complete len:433 (-) Transcript_135666:496-1794(-)